MSRLRGRARARRGSLPRRRWPRRNSSSRCGIWRRVIAAALAATFALTPALVMAYDWPQFDGNSWHSGDNTRERAITPANVGALQRLFQVTLPNDADSAPAYLSGVSTPSGVRDLLFLTTTDGHILALDAHTGSQVWSRQYPAGTCRINNGSSPCYTTASPAVDPNRQYVYTYGLDGAVHKLRAGDGGEITGGGWPELATRKPFDEKGSSSLSTASTPSGAFLYVTNSGYPGDQGDYQGHLTTISLATGAQHVFNVLCGNQVNVHFVEKPGSPDCPQVQGAVWPRPGVIYDPGTNKLYVATSNGTFAPGSNDWGDSVLALHPDGSGASGTGTPLDSYTPANYQQLDDDDLDLGSTAPALLPAQPGSTVRHLAVQSGKDGLLRLLNLDNLSGKGGPGHTGGEVGAVINVPQGGEVLTQPAVWVNPADGRTWVFVANDNGTAGLRLAVNGSGVPYLQPMWQLAAPGASPLVANGVLFEVTSNVVKARDPVTGNLLWTDTSIGGIHWQSPVVANGMLYIADSAGRLSAYGLVSGTYYGTLPAAGSSDSYTFIPSATGTATLGSCALSTANSATLSVYNSGGTLLGRDTSGSYCAWASAGVSAGQSYVVKTVGGAGAYRSAWSLNGAVVVWNVASALPAEGRNSQTVSFPALGAGTITLATCGPSGTTFDLALLDASYRTLASAATPAICESLTYNAPARGLFRLQETATSGGGAWSGTIETH